MYNKPKEYLVELEYNLKIVDRLLAEKTEDLNKLLREKRFIVEAIKEIRNNLELSKLKGEK